MRRTKIVATIGPASEDPVALERLIRAGTDVCRLNLSHGPLTDHLRRLAAIRDISAHVGRHVAVMVDLPGPKIRAGQFPEGGVELAPGSTVRLRSGDGPSTAEVISVDYPDLVVHVDVGERVVLGDGEISMRVVSKTRRRARRRGRIRRAHAGSAGHPPGLRAAGARMLRRRRTSSWPRRWQPPGPTTSPCRSCDRPPTSTSCGRSSVTGRGSSPRSRRLPPSSSWRRSPTPPTR